MPYVPHDAVLEDLSTVVSIMPGLAHPIMDQAVLLNEDSLAQTLQWAGSGAQQQIQSASAQLERWQTEPGFYKHLQTIFITQGLPVDIRYLAIIQLKNGIDKYWRKTATNAVSAEDKNVIRSRLIQSGLDERHEPLALQNALVVAKIVRYEYPQTWPDVIPTLLNAVRTAEKAGASAGGHMQLARAQLILLYVVKELSSSRLSRSRQNLNAATPEIVGVIGALYVQRTRNWLECVQNGAPADDVSTDIELSLISARMLRRLLISGYDFPSRSSEVADFWNITRELFHSLVTLQAGQAESNLPSHQEELIGKHLLQLSKLHLKMAETNAIASVLLPHAVDIANTYWNIIKQCGDFLVGQSRSQNAQPQIGTVGDQAGDRTVLERVSLMGMLLIRAYIKMSCNPTQSLRYRKQDDKEEEAQARKLVRETLLTPDFIVDIMNVTVSKFFILRDSELWEWEAEPEDWEAKEENEGEGYEFSLRPCAERLFFDVVMNFIDILQEPLMRLFDTAASPDFGDVLLKESVYSALGIAAPKIHQQFDFDTLLTITLASEVRKAEPNCHILRRRIAILIGQWITIRISAENRSLVFEIFQYLLDQSDAQNDLVVRITAARHFRSVADDWEFDAKKFLPYAPTVMTRLMKLIEEVETMDTKLAILTTISVAVERLEHHISPFANQIIELLPPLWDQSGEEHIMKQAILALLTRLVNSMKADSEPYHALLTPLIRGVVEPGSDSQLYLLDDALDLWHAILVQSKGASTPVISLMQNLLDIFDLGSESLRKALEILHSYILLAPNDMLADSVRKPLLLRLTALFGTLRPEDNGNLSNVVELLIRSAETLGGEAAVKQILVDLVEVEAFPKLLDGLHEAYVAHGRTGPLAKAPSVDGIVETDYFSVLARLVLGSTNGFADAISQQTRQQSDSADNVAEKMTWLLEEWFRHMDNISDVGRRKLMTMALTKLLETNQPFILSNLQLLMSLWTDIITELREVDYPSAEDEIKAKDPMADRLVYDDPTNASTADQEIVISPEDERRKQLGASDIVHRVRLAEYVRHFLGMAVQACGGEEGFQNDWLVNVDKEVIAGFAHLGIM